MASIFELLTQNDKRTNRDSLLGVQTGSFRDIAGDIIGSRKKKEKKATKYLAGALFLGLGDILTQNKMQKKFDAFTQNDTVARSKIKQEFEDYTNFMAKHNTYTSGGQKDWQEGLRLDIMSKYGNLAEGKIQETYQQEADNYAKLLDRYTTGKFEGSLKTKKTYEELLAPYEKIASKAKRQLNPENAGFLKNVFGNVLGIRDSADEILEKTEAETQQYLNSFNAAVAKTASKYDIQPNEYLTSAQQYTNKVAELKNKAASNQDLTIADVEEMYQYGINPSAIPALKDIQQTNIGDFMETFTKVKAIKSRRQDADPTDFLTAKERDLYDVAMGITRDEINAKDEITNDTNRLTVVSSIKNKIAQDSELSQTLSLLDGDFGTDGTDATGQSSVFISNVIRGAAVLQNKYDMNEPDAYSMSFNMQLKGISKGTGGTQEEVYGAGFSGFMRQITTFEKETHSVEYVNPDVENLPILPETAQQYADNLNQYNYMQQNKGYTDENGIEQNMVPRQGKEFTVAGEGFEIDFIAQQKDNEFVWVPFVTITQ
jgi:hypothetical protein